MHESAIEGILYAWYLQDLPVRSPKSSLQVLRASTVLDKILLPDT